MTVLWICILVDQFSVMYDLGAA